MMMLSYPYGWLPVVIVVGLLAASGVWLFAFVWLAVFLVVVFAVVVALGWGLLAASRDVGRRLWRRWALSGSVSGSELSQDSVSLRTRQ